MQTENVNNNTAIFRFDAIGTRWEIETFLPLKASHKQKVLNRIAIFDKTYSRFRNDSIITEIANSSRGGCFEFPQDSLAIFDLYDQLHHITIGAVDPLIGNQLELLGYDKNYTLTPRANVSKMLPHNWTKDVVRNGETIMTKQPVTIDIGAAGKGYLVDLVSEVLLEEGIKEFIIDAGGDMLHKGNSIVRIGLEHPLEPKNVIGVVELNNGSICASASNRRTWGNGLHHLLDARHGMPVKDVIATWALAENALLADGLATALFFTGAGDLQHYFGFSSVKMFSNKTVEVSENFKGEIFFR